MPKENAINEVAALSETRVVAMSTVYMREMVDDAVVSGDPDDTYPWRRRRASDEEGAKGERGSEGKGGERMERRRSSGWQGQGRRAEAEKRLK